MAGSARMTILETERLRLRPARESDLDALHVVLTDPEVMRYWSTPPHATLDETRTWLTKMMAAAPEQGIERVIEHAGEVVGKVAFFRLSEVGFILRRDLWGRGIAREAVARLIAHVWATYDVSTLSADVDPRNDASIGLLARLGFVESGRAERTWCVGGVWCDSVYLKLARPVAP
jgi:ribosomal-protein-alanine N-acetyltransferase